MTEDQNVQEILNFLRANMHAEEQSRTLLDQELKEIKETVKQNNRALRGSNGEAGLVSEVTSLCAAQRASKKTIDEIDGLLHKGIRDEPGLVEQVRELRRFQKSLRYWYLLFIGAIVTSVISIGLTLLSRFMFPGG